jgi:hypothetical protein
VPFDPLEIIVEILGQPAATMRNPVNADYNCPFLASVCIKRSQRSDGPYPLCTIRNGRKDPKQICVCPKRFYQIDLVHDIVKHCWPGTPPENPILVHEVQMSGFGNVDFVIADIDPLTEEVKSFVSAELQAADITGSVESAYNAVLNSQMMEKMPSSGINWANVRKRFITQLTTKAYFHHQWNSRMIAIVQTVMYERFRKDIHFDELPISDSNNVVFMLYDYQPVPGGEDGEQQLVLDRVVATTHSSILTGILYMPFPPKEAYIKRIKARMRKTHPR